jgi:hypothetical protein
MQFLLYILKFQATPVLTEVSACAQTSRLQTYKEAMTEVVRAIRDVRKQEMGFRKASDG